MLNVALFVFSLGVGGEYPMASTTASERSAQEHVPRGRTVTFVFAHQGWGTVAFCIVLTFFLAATKTGSCSSSALNHTAPGSLLTSSSPCDPVGLEITWRMSYAFGVLALVPLFLYRWCFLQESELWKQRRAKYDSMGADLEREQRKGNFKLLFSRAYFPRLFGAAASWFVWDVAFYGNKLFQGTLVLSIIGSNASLLQTLQFTLLNSVVALLGYYAAAFSIDKTWMGRVRMQLMGFAVSCALFLTCAAAYTSLTQPDGIAAFEFIYLASSFWGQVRM